MGHFDTEYKKAKKTQGKALITENKDWMDSDSEDEEVSYTPWQMLMSQKPQLLIRYILQFMIVI